jgi:hypothetical protein
MSVAANRIADTVVPLLLTLNVSLISVMIIPAPPLPKNDQHAIQNGSRGQSSRSAAVDRRCRGTAPGRASARQ